MQTMTQENAERAAVRRAQFRAVAEAYFAGMAKTLVFAKWRE